VERKNLEAAAFAASVAGDRNVNERLLVER
jgi:hypothetical protein